MRQKSNAIALIVLMVSIIVLTTKLFASRSIQILIEDGQAIPVEGGGYFTFADALVLIVSSWAAGMAAFYLLLPERVEMAPAKKMEIAPLALKLLRGDERKVYKHILDSGGEMLQKDLIMETSFDKAKVTRLLNKLEEKDLILKIKHGMTNRIVLKDQH